MATYTADIIEVEDLGDGTLRIDFTVMAQRDAGEYPPYNGEIVVAAALTREEIVAEFYASPGATAFREAYEAYEAAEQAEEAEVASLPVQPGEVIDLDGPA